MSLICDVVRGVVLALLTLGAAHAAENEVLKNWFNDPFFQIASGMPSCPVPLGPLLSETEMKSESHARAERGTSCWMAGECMQPNAYLYDAGIARAIRERLADDAAFRGASLWVTVKRRFVWLQGCVADDSQATRLEAVLRAVPDVERVIVDVMHGTAGKPPYQANKR